MFKYKIGYNSCEESHYWEFFSEIKYTQDALVKIVQEVLWKTLQRILVVHKENQWGWHPNFQDLFESPLFIEGMKNMGFTEIAYDEELSLFGWASSYEIGDWKSYADNTTKDMQTFLDAKIKGDPGATEIKKLIEDNKRNW